ncbi:glycoside hydrolase family 3 protein [Marinihelvus fidelis]|uniref:Glycoside hydrolase family 3 protein n=1 Tax=Marinihelvus fidelis TaxID=2613842 RepID=A0A5N0T667_9GAMM|nr:glycoside hydrolase family 3 protein [Marinihelvus fidelis]KAA9130545.1 glycoside hydrolase family 3 protein [Marinihelvus fidelis]
MLMTACGPSEPAGEPQAAAEAEPAATQPAVETTTPVEQAGAGIDADNWPAQSSPFQRDPAMEAEIEALMAKMTLEEKVGQVIQPDIASVTPADVKKYHLGSVLNGGGSAPQGDLRIEPQAWLDLADEFWDVSTDTSDGYLGIPAIWGTDAVHGHGNVTGATLFPHNIGLGAANDPELMERIGEITALEMLATGMDWTFAPTIAVVRNDRWGRTYEGYSEDPRIVAEYAPRIITGIQGRPGDDDFLRDGHMIATAKHFVGDGGTVNGHDQGNNVATEAELRDIHAAGYPPAIAAGVQTVMASFNSFHGRKLHGYDALLTDVLVGRMGLDGFVVGDWNGHGQVAGCSNTACAQSFNAGLDMFMAPDSWKGLYENTLEQVRSGEISMARLDEAVARILRVKFRADVFNAGRPSSRDRAGDFELLGAPAHRAVAREAVRKSLVLLKNANGVLPIAADATVLVAGDGAHDIGKQSGGWTLSWQGTGNQNSDFPNATSIYDGFAEVLAANGGRAVLSESGDWEEKPDVAVVVFGEDPYAEGVGDRKHVDYVPHDGLELLRRFREDGIPAVAVFLSGRPMYVNPELNASDAFVAAWLPGGEGAGIADVLVAAADGAPAHDFTGRLSFSWPRDPEQVEVNVGDADYDPLFAYGFGLSYGDEGALAALPEDADTVAANIGELMAFGDPVGTWELALQDDGRNRVHDSRGASHGGNVSVQPFDDEVQEDALRVTWTGPAALVIEGPSRDFTGMQGAALEITFSMQSLGDANMSVGMHDGSYKFREMDVSGPAAGMVGQGWQTQQIDLACFGGQGVTLSDLTAPFVLTATGPAEVLLKSVRVVENAAAGDC